MEARRKDKNELLRDALADLRKNGRNYFLDPGLMPRLIRTLLNALFWPALTYAAISGILPALILWSMNADQFTQELAANAENGHILFETLKQAHVLSLKLAGLALVIVIVTSVLLPPRRPFKMVEQ